MKHEFLNPEKEITLEPIKEDIDIVKLIDKYFQSYNSARLKEICHLLRDKIINEDVIIGVSLSGALTPAGLGTNIIAPMIEKGYIDWISSTGANLYHDLHFSLGLKLFKGKPFIDDRFLKKEAIVRIYDILLKNKVLFETDNFLKKIFKLSDFTGVFSSARFHFLIGKYINEYEISKGIKYSGLLASAYKYEVPIYTPSPGDSSIGMNIAYTNLLEKKFTLDPFLDVIETSAIVYYAKKKGYKSAVILLGGGAPKNFVLQTEPFIQEILGLEEVGHDYFIQITDARPDTGGLSGATPSEAVSWGKVDPNALPNTIVCYTDLSIALPLIASYLFSLKIKRSHKRRLSKIDSFVKFLKKDFSEKILKIN